MKLMFIMCAIYIILIGSESKKKILKWLDKVLDLVVPESQQCKVFYNQKREYGVFHHLK